MKDSVLPQSIQLSATRLLTAMVDGRAWLIDLNSARVAALAGNGRGCGEVELGCKLRRSCNFCRS